MKYGRSSEVQVEVGNKFVDCFDGCIPFRIEHTDYKGTARSWFSANPRGIVVSRVRHRISIAEKATSDGNR